MSAAPPIAERTLQRYADEFLLPEYRQPLKTIEDACTAVGWKFAERPVCCGAEVHVRSLLGGAYEAECLTCGAMIKDVGGPEFGNGHVKFLEAEQFAPGALDVDARWIAVPATASAGQHFPGRGFDDSRSIQERMAEDAYKLADAMLALRSSGETK